MLWQADQITHSNCCRLLRTLKPNATVQLFMHVHRHLFTKRNKSNFAEEEATHPCATWKSDCSFRNKKKLTILTFSTIRCMHMQRITSNIYVVLAKSPSIRAQPILSILFANESCSLFVP